MSIWDSLKTHLSENDGQLQQSSSWFSAWPRFALMAKSLTLRNLSLQGSFHFSLATCPKKSPFLLFLPQGFILGDMIMIESTEVQILQTIDIRLNLLFNMLLKKEKVGLPKAKYASAASRRGFSAAGNLIRVSPSNHYEAFHTCTNTNPCCST